MRFFKRFFLLLTCFSASAQAANLPGTSWISDRLPDSLIGLSVVPVKDPHRADIVALGQSGLTVYQLQEGRLSKVSEIKHNAGEEWIKLTAADVDHDGLYEVILSGFYHDRVVSRVLSFKDGQARTVAEIPYYVSRYRWRGKDILAAQKRHGAEDFSGHIYELTASNDKFSIGPDLGIVKGLSVTSPSLYSIEGFGSGYLYLDSVGVLQLVDGSPLMKKWASSQAYGGAAFYLDRRIRGPLNDFENDRFFVPMGFKVLEEYPAMAYHPSIPESLCPDPTVACVEGPKDSGGDSVFVTPAADEKTVYLVKNEGYLKSVVGATPSVKSSQLVKLQWTGFGFQEVWSSPRFDGAITDLTLVDWDGDKKEEILATLLLRDRGYSDTLKKQDSLLIVVKPGP